jgi:hypothetical protein
MNKRKRKGIGFGLTGLVFLLAGGIFYFADTTPEWLPMLISIIGTIAGTLGFTFIYPDIDDES